MVKESNVAVELVQSTSAVCPCKNTEEVPPKEEALTTVEIEHRMLDALMLLASVENTLPCGGCGKLTRTANGSSGFCEAAVDAGTLSRTTVMGDGANVIAAGAASTPRKVHTMPTVVVVTGCFDGIGH